MKVLFWPFTAFWKLVGSIMNLTGRLIAVILGFSFLIIGIILSFSIIGAIIGIPLVILGFTMIIRGFF
ncbi:MAG TPA: hypothetical protein GXZ27_02030 [Thermoanaerobacterales bacterium]|nr:hypothetical protein [Thermoanaerobacterales bacterium]